eukprot:10082861-Lingulodinium_polyedra.AAC.1
MHGHSHWLLARLDLHCRSRLYMAQHMQGHRRPAALEQARPPGILPALATRPTSRRRLELLHGPRVSDPAPRNSPVPC